MYKLRSGPKFDLTIFFATDIHGSTLCFKKVLAAPGFYEKQGYQRFGGMSGSPEGGSRHFYVKNLRPA